MRIVLIAPRDEDLGGVACVLRHLASYLKRCGHQVIFVFPGDNFFPKKKISRFGFPGFEIRMQLPFGARSPIISLPLFLILFPIGIYQLIRLLRKQRIQIINIHYPTDCFFYLAVCSRLLSLPLISSIHGADVFPDGKRPRRYSRAFGFLMNTSSLIVAPSKQLRELFVATFPALASKTIFVHNGIDLTEVQHSSLSERSSSGAGSEPEDGCASRPYILCVSAYKQQKAIDVLIRAFKAVRTVHPAIKLVIVGGGHLRQEMENLAETLGVKGGVDFEDARPHSAVLALMRGCEVFVLPSRFETFGIVILEAMACGKPVVATKVGGIPEVVESGKNGILVEPDCPEALARALTAVLEDPKLRNDLAVHGRATVEACFQSRYSGSAYERAFTALLS